MRALLALLWMSSVVSSFGLPAAGPPPPTPIRPVHDVYFGHDVVDDYRWLEDLSSFEVQGWMKAQDTYARHYLEQLPDREALIRRVEELDHDAVQVGRVREVAGSYFYLKSLPDDETPKLYVREGLSGTERLLVDPQVLWGTSQRFALSGFSPSPDARLVAVTAAAGGSEQGVLHIVDVASGQVLPDVIEQSRNPSVSWEPNGKSFFYQRNHERDSQNAQQDKELDREVMLHRVGQPAESDAVVLSRGTCPELRMAPNDEPTVSVDWQSNYILGVIQRGVSGGTRLLVCPEELVDSGHPAWQTIAALADHVTSFDYKGNDLWFVRHFYPGTEIALMHLNLNDPDLSHAKLVLRAGREILSRFSVARDGVYVKMRRDGVERMRRLPNGKNRWEDVNLPVTGELGGPGTSDDMDGFLVHVSGWTQAPQWYRYDPHTNALTNTQLEPENTVDMSGITSSEVEATAPDGTAVPLSIICQRGLVLDGSHPCLLDGYGAYGKSTLPYFDAKLLALLERGGVIAYAHVRGGGEKGTAWAEAGHLLTKHNTIDDFLACANYLVSHGYTSARKLTGFGTSAGGITIGCAMTERPSAFGLAICNVGLVNPLRMEQGPNGPANTTEFGSVRTLDGFRSLYEMDAYHHVQNGVYYPTVLLVTGANDPRVDPWQLCKMTARLQAATASPNPVLLRIDYDAGHGIGSTKQQRDLLLADIFALMLSVAKQADQPVAKGMDYHGG